MTATIEAPSIPVHVMIRPRGEDFACSACEFGQMRRQVEKAKKAGAAGIAFGVLHPDGRVDVVRSRALVELAYPMKATFHRAFDAAPELSEALEAVIQTGADSLLTSGGKPDVLTRADAIARLRKQAGDRLPASARVTYAQGSALAMGLAVPVARTALQTGSDEGLLGEYFSNPALEGKPIVTRVDRRIDFDLNRVEPLPRLGSAYSIRWTGELKPPAAGNYSLHVKIDRCFDCKGHDGYRLWVDGNELLEDDGSGKEREDAVMLEWKDARTHAIRLELLHTGEDEGIHLEWGAPARAQLDEALAQARQADVIVATVGLSPSLEGEALGIKVPGFFGGDRETLELPEPQRKLLAALATLHKPIVLALRSVSTSLRQVA
jgi:hypothetical protein